MSELSSSPSARFVGPVLLLGVGGMLWRAWDELLERASIRRVSPSLEELDLTRPATIDRVIDGSAPLVINCAAYTDVDGAESNEALATEINGTGVGRLAARCAAVGATLVHYSTDYVFDGQASEPYAPDHPRQPINAYGRSKAVGEAAVESSGVEFLLIRTSWLYAPWGRNFVRTMARLTANRPTLRVVADQRGRPTSAEHLADATWRLLQLNQRGAMHVTDGGDTTWHGFASEIARRTGAACEVNACTTAEYPTPAPRPRYSVLDLRATESLLGPMPHWTDSLQSVLDRLEP